MTISPNLGEIGAPQLGHFRDVAPEGARITSGVADGAAEVGAEPAFCAIAATLVPHFMQKVASSGSWVPHLGQNMLIKLS
jgi:hypothetical protein